MQSMNQLQLMIQPKLERPSKSLEIHQWKLEKPSILNKTMISKATQKDNKIPKDNKTLRNNKIKRRNELKYNILIYSSLIN